VAVEDQRRVGLRFESSLDAGAGEAVGLGELTVPPEPGDVVA
jgi:hypothetical protein